MQLFRVDLRIALTLFSWGGGGRRGRVERGGNTQGEKELEKEGEGKVGEGRREGEERREGRENE